MSIIDLQRKARQLGEIRLGDTTTKDGKTYPISLDTFRLTSISKGLLDQAAKMWGGEVTPWQPREGGTSKWQLVTDISELPVVVPPQDPDDVTHYELWTAGGLQRRCDGKNIINKGEPSPCVCDPDNRECNMVTRIQLMLPDMPDVGIWLLKSTGYYAAAEMAMSIQLVMQAAQKTGLLPAATLAIEHREVKRPGDPTKRFVVPVLRFADTLSTFLDSGSGRYLPGGSSGGDHQEGSGTVHTLPESSPVLSPTDRDPFIDGGAYSIGQLRPATDIEATTKLMETRNQLQAEADEEFVYAPGENPLEGVDLAWEALLELLEEQPDEGRMGPIQNRVYRLFKYMETAKLWGEADKTRHAALQKAYSTIHLTDLRMAELHDFAVRAFDAAKEKVADQEKETDNDG